MLAEQPINPQTDSQQHDDDDDDNDDDVQCFCSRKILREVKHTMNLCLDNKYVEAETILQKNADESIYHSLGYSSILCIKAVMTFNKADIGAAMERLNYTLNLSNKQARRDSWLGSFAKWMGAKSNTAYSQMELHAELVIAEASLLKGLLTFIEEESLMNFVKGTMIINSCHKTYQQCLKLLNDNKTLITTVNTSNTMTKLTTSASLPSPQSTTTSSSSSISIYDSQFDLDFTSGVRFGVGSFQVLLSLLPPRLLRLCSAFGFKGDRIEGLNHLHLGSQGGLRDIGCTLFLLFYHSVIGVLFELPDSDLNFAQNLLDSQLDQHPNGALLLYFKGRILHSSAKYGLAVDAYQSAINAQNEWRQLHLGCYWEMFWCNALRLKWSEAAACAEVLSREGLWAVGFVTYLFAVSIYAAGGWKKTDQVTELMARVPTLFKRIAGKSIPNEKFAMLRAKRFAEKGELFLPELEMIYIYNGLRAMEQSVYQKCLSDVEAQFNRKLDSEDTAVSFLMQQVLYAQLGEAEKSTSAASSVMNLLSTKAIKPDLYVIPYSRFEFGRLLLTQGKYEESWSEMKAALNNYSNFIIESRLHMRIHCAMQQVPEEYRD